MEQEFKEHRQSPPDKGAKARTIADYTEKEHYLDYKYSQTFPCSHLY
jgi:hypothetical protein